MQYKLLAIDLDGTLTNNEKKITPYTKDRLFKAMDKGVKIILASGRPDIGISPLAKELELYSRGGYILAFNGGRIIDCALNSVISETTLPKECFDSVISLRDRFSGIEVLSYTSRGIAAGSITKYVMEECRCNACKAYAYADLKSALPEKVVKFLIVGDHEKLLPVKEYLTESFSDKFGAYFSQPFFLEVVPFGIDKANSLKKLLNVLSLPRSALMAVGDGENDIPMLKVASLSVAMENASPSVKEIAGYVTKSNEEDGVGFAVQKFILDEETL